MYWTKKHVLVCTAIHCQKKGAMDVAGRLRLDVIRKGLDTEILVNNCGTIDLCDVGPNIVVYPENIIYRGVTVKDIPDIVEYLRGGPLVERLLLSPEGTEERARHDFYQVAVEGDATRATTEFEVLAAQHGFDAAWVSEQQSRGFIARKPGSDGEPETITVTKKSRARYSV